MPTIPFGLPPWVGTPANPAQVYAEGLQIGARIGSQQAAQLFQQQQLAQQQQRMAMEQQQQEVENQRNAQLLNLKVAETARKHQASQEFRARIGAGEDPARVLMELGPELGESPADVLNAQRMREQTKAMADYRNASLSLAEKRLKQPTAATQESTQLAEWKQQIESETDPQKRKFLQNQIDAMEARHGLMETSVTSGPGGVTEIRMTKGSRSTQALTPTEQTRLGDDVQATAGALRVLNPLQNKLDSGVVGIVPTIGNVVFDEVLSQFAPDLVDKHRVGARQDIQIATQQVLGELNNRGRFSNMELNAIKNMMPGLGVRESPGAAHEKLMALRKMLAEKGANAATQLKRPVPSETIRALSEIFPDDEALLKEFQSGAINNQIFWQVYNFRHPKGK